MDHELVEKFIEVTGAGEAVAAQYLALADGNVETAISLMFEGAGADATEEQPAVTPVETEVRAPIPQTREVLVPAQPVCAYPTASNNVFDRFRDFAVETQRQEEEMARRATGMRKTSPRKTRRLEDLFRPPYDLMFLGSFVEARERAKYDNRWLLVNIQNPQEFSCQILNRDLWPDERIREMIRDHFILWQVTSNTTDGQRYIDFYNVIDYPYLAVLDPRTGECVRIYNQITIDSLVAGLNDMLSMHASPDSAPQLATGVADDWSAQTVKSMPKRCIADTKSQDNESSTCSKKPKVTQDKNDADDDTRTRTSEINDSGAGPSMVKPFCVSTTRPSNNVTILSKRSKMEGSSSTNNHEILHSLLEKKVESPNGLEPNASVGEQPTLRLCLRLPNGGKEALTMSASDTIRNFLNRMETLGFPPSDHTYLVPFPRTNIGSLSQQTRLSDTILFPSNTVFITKI